jgi:hypothetical protein
MTRVVKSSLCKVESISDNMMKYCNTTALLLFVPSCTRLCMPISYIATSFKAVPQILLIIVLQMHASQVLLESCLPVNTIAQNAIKSYVERSVPSITQLLKRRISFILSRALRHTRDKLTIGLHDLMHRSRHEAYRALRIGLDLR